MSLAGYLLNHHRYYSLLSICLYPNNLISDLYGIVLGDLAILVRWIKSELHLALVTMHEYSTTMGLYEDMQTTYPKTTFVSPKNLRNGRIIAQHN